eukprot:7483085-Pyramimonas_sp.AAC.1
MKQFAPGGFHHQVDEAPRPGPSKAEPVIIAPLPWNLSLVHPRVEPFKILSHSPHPTPNVFPQSV